ncbi:MAG: LysM domain-containing protein [Candidatus Woesearchaeota archaeon]
MRHSVYEARNNIQEKEALPPSTTEPESIEQILQEKPASQPIKTDIQPYNGQKEAVQALPNQEDSKIKPAQSSLEEIARTVYTSGTKHTFDIHTVSTREQIEELANLLINEPLKIAESEIGQYIRSHSNGKTFANKGVPGDVSKDVEAALHRIRQIIPQLKYEAARHGLPGLFIIALGMKETYWKNEISSANAIGALGWTERTGRGYGLEAILVRGNEEPRIHYADATNFIIAARKSAEHVRDLLNDFGSLAVANAAYNSYKPFRYRTQNNTKKLDYPSLARGWASESKYLAKNWEEIENPNKKLSDIIENMAHLYGTYGIMKVLSEEYKHILGQPAAEQVLIKPYETGYGKIVEVKSGDTLWKIGKNNSVSVAAIRVWNGIKPNDMLKKGQLLKLPPAKDTVITRISKKYGMNLQVLYELNPQLKQAIEMPPILNVVLKNYS